MKCFVFVFMLVVVLFFVVYVVEYNQVQLDKSVINFIYKQMGVLVDGKFCKFVV